MRQLVASDAYGVRAELRKYSEDEARDDHGRWSSGGGGKVPKAGWRRSMGQSPLDHQAFARSPRATTVATGSGKERITVATGPRRTLLFAAWDRGGAYVGSYTNVAGAANVGWGRPPSEADHIAAEARAGAGHLAGSIPYPPIQLVET